MYSPIIGDIKAYINVTLIYLNYFVTELLFTAELHLVATKRRSLRTATQGQCHQAEPQASKPYHLQTVSFDLTILFYQVCVENFVPKLSRISSIQFSLFRLPLSQFVHY